MTKQLLIVTAAAETGIGVSMVFAPAIVARLLLGAELDGPAAAIVGRIAGAALLSFGAACWVARDDHSSGRLRGLVATMALYNTIAITILVYAGISLKLVGVLLWPAVLLHAALAVWCVACLRTARAQA